MIQSTLDAEDDLGLSMSPAECGASGTAIEPSPAAGHPRWRRPDARRMLQLALATVWLLDGVLQLQPSMFTPGSKGLSGMIGGLATGNPTFVARSITWNASIVDHHAVATNAVFATIQVLIGLGIAWRPTVKPAFSVSVVWSLLVWWFGEGLGGVLHGAATPVGGGPGAVLFYALLAVLLWPTDRTGADASFVAARGVGLVAAKIVWVVVWLGLAVLTLVGSGRSPQGIRQLVRAAETGEPGWLAGLDRHAGSLAGQHGLVAAVLLAVVCVVVALGVFLAPRPARVTIVLAVVAAALVWVVGENFGAILAGGATDPNSGPLLALLALAYWPLGSFRSAAAPPVSAAPVSAVSATEPVTLAGLS